MASAAGVRDIGRLHPSRSIFLNEDIHSSSKTKYCIRALQSKVQDLGDEGSRRRARVGNQAPQCLVTELNSILELCVCDPSPRTLMQREARHGQTFCKIC
jgi:hypothetical protein